ncbi:MAG: AraC family transcriptional regulator [Desulfobacteraceae bacterium]|nr:MAG: AraC family transcriptional regulator [Desulfobacteraceae bacterium]
MSTFDYIASVIFFFGSSLALFSAVVMITIKTGNPKANRWLGLFCLSTAALLTRGFLLHSGFYTHLPLFTEWIDNLRYFLPFTILFYVKTVAFPDFRLKKWDLLHLGPVAFNIVIKWPDYFNTSDQQIRYLAQWLDSSLMQSGFYADLISRVIFNLHFMVCLVWALIIYRKSKDTIMRATPFGKVYISWIRLFTFPFLPSYVIWVPGALLLAGRFSMRYFYCSLNLFVSMLVFFFVYRVFTRPEILFMARAQKAAKKYNASYLTPAEAEIHFKKLLNLMEEKEVYLDPDLTLFVLADQLAIHKNYLSQIINEKTNRTFNDFINAYRIEKVKKLLTDPERKEATILDLAFEAGFNSKTPFNNAFKRQTGESPIAWRKKNLK